MCSDSQSRFRTCRLSCREVVKQHLFAQLLVEAHDTHLIFGIGLESRRVNGDNFRTLIRKIIPFTDNHATYGSLSLESGIIEICPRSNQIAETLDSLLRLDGDIGRHRADVTHGNLEVVRRDTGLLGFEEERLHSRLCDLAILVHFTGNDDKLHVGIDILTKIDDIEESGIEIIGLILGRFRTESTYIRMQASSD